MLVDAHRVARDDTIRSQENLAQAFDHDISHAIEIYDLSLKTVANGIRQTTS